MKKPQPSNPTAFPIKKNAPIPNKERISYPEKYPWAQMKVGDSFFIPDREKPLTTTYAARKHNMKFTQRSMDGGIRIWRIK